MLISQYPKYFNIFQLIALHTSPFILMGPNIDWEQLNLLSYRSILTSAKHLAKNPFTGFLYHSVIRLILTKSVNKQTSNS